MPFTAEDGNPKLKSGARMVFLNQFFGPTILGNTICETVVNERDGCLQSSMFGPDTCPFPIRHVNIADQPGMVMAESRETVTRLTTGRKTLVLHRKEPTKSARKRIMAAKAAGQHSAARWIKLFGRRKFDDESKSVVIVVTDEKNKPINEKKTSKVPDKYRWRYAICSPSDMRAKRMMQRVYYLEKRDLLRLVDLDSDRKPKFQDVDHLLEDICAETHTLPALNLCEELDCPPTCHIFAGQSAPTIDDSFGMIGVPSVGLNVHYSVKTNSDVRAFHSLSTSFVCDSTQSSKLTHRDLEITRHAFTSRGSYEDRKGKGNRGHCSYNGLKKEHGPSIRTPTEGPGVKGRYMLYRQTTNTFFVLGGIHLMTRLASTAHWSTSFLFLPLILMRELITGHNNIMKIALWTIDFMNYLHVDKNDRFTPEQRGKMSGYSEHISNSEFLDETEKSALRNHETFTSDFTPSIPTACCYQFVPTQEGQAESTKEVEVQQGFLMLGAGCVLRVPNYWTQIFRSGSVMHCTTVPVFIVDEMVEFGTCSLAEVAAWGGGTCVRDMNERQLANYHRNLARRRDERRQQARLRNMAAGGTGRLPPNSRGRNSIRTPPTSSP